MTSSQSSETKHSPWFWVPSLYFAEGIPYVMVMLVSVTMYKRLGISNTDIALYTSWLYLPWVIKPLWSPIVDLLRTKRFWIVTTQLIIGAGLAGVALTIPASNFFQYTLAFMWLLAFSSATHDIAADGFYMLGLSEHDQAWFVGIRSTFYRIAMITGQGLLIMLAGFIESNTGLPEKKLEVIASPRAVESRFFAADSLTLDRTGGELHLQSFPNKIEILTDGMTQQKADSVIEAAKAWNRENGFYEVVEAKSQDAGSSFWYNFIGVHLEEFLRENFAPEEKVETRTDVVGNIAPIYFYLSKQPEPGEDVVVNYGLESGDKSIRLIEGERFVFNAENWDKPFIVLLQLDPKLQTATTANFAARAGNIPLSWTISVLVLAAMFVVFFIYHGAILPRPASDAPTAKGEANFVANFALTFWSFFKKKHMLVTVAFLLLYRFGEAQLVKLASPFLLDSREVGGLALTTGEVGFVYGTVGVAFLTFGGILGGLLAAKDGLKRWLWPMVIAINLPNAVYIYLSYTVPDSFLVINACVAIEQFGYGFGFTAFMLYMIYAAEGEHKTAHFAFCTGLMALGMMIPGMFSGWLQEIIGYQHFFVWVVLATIPGFIVTGLIPLDPEFGKKQE